MVNTIFYFLVKPYKRCDLAILGKKEMFYLTTHSTHFIYGYMVSDIWYRTTHIAREETRCRHIGYSFRFAASDLLHGSPHRQDNTYHGLCYTSRGALAGTRNSSMGPPWRIDPMTHRTMSECSYHGATSRSRVLFTSPSWLVVNNKTLKTDIYHSTDVHWKWRI